MKTSNLVKSVLHTGIGVAGAAGAQYAGTMLPASVDPMYADLGKVVLGGLVLPMLTKGAAGEYLSSFGNGMAIQGGLNLVNQYLIKPTAYARVGGVDNSNFISTWHHKSRNEATVVYLVTR